MNAHKAQLIAKELTVLDDEHIALAEAIILPELVGKTPGQLAKLAALAVATVDPEGTLKRREHAEREDARAQLWREHTGASALAAYGLPTDAALSAHANIGQRAGEYKQARVMPDARMDQLRVLAFCDILNGVTAADRIAQAQAEADCPAEQDGDPGDDNGGPAGGASAAPGSGGAGPARRLQPDAPAGHPARPGRAVRRGPRPRPPRPRPGPRPGRRRGWHEWTTPSGRTYTQGPMKYPA
jgi:hypothetical protein